MCVLGNCKTMQLSGLAHFYVCACGQLLSNIDIYATLASKFEGPKEPHRCAPLPQDPQTTVHSPSSKEHTSSARCCRTAIAVTCMMCIVGLMLGTYFIQG